MGKAVSLRPGVVIASSDSLHVIIGYWLARWLGVPFYADLYDDYATFGLSKIPGVKPLYRAALAGAVGISVVSRTLGEDICRRYPGKQLTGQQ